MSLLVLNVTLLLRSRVCAVWLRCIGAHPAAKATTVSPAEYAPSSTLSLCTPLYWFFFSIELLRLLRTHHRCLCALRSQCQKCPDNPWLLIIGFVVIIIAAGIVGYVLNKKAVNVAFLSIGVDYFQVLAIFSRSNIKWPTGMTTCHR